MGNGSILAILNSGSGDAWGAALDATGISFSGVPTVSTSDGDRVVADEGDINVDGCEDGSAVDERV